MKSWLILSHSEGLISQTEICRSWREIKIHVFGWGAYCERLRVKPDKPRIRLYAA